MTEVVGEASSTSDRPLHKYGEAQEWNSRYQTDHGDTFFDWYAGFAELEHILRAHVQDVGRSPADMEVLMVGCGNSKLSEELHDQGGYRRIVNVDISEICIDKMKRLYSETHPSLEWHAMDATKMTLGDKKFDLSIDKGTIDAVVCGEDGLVMVTDMIHEMGRTLKPGGLAMIITHSEDRAALFDMSVASRCPAWDWKLVHGPEKCHLSPSALLINIMRSHMPGKPVAAIMKDPVRLKAAMMEYKDAMAARGRPISGDKKAQQELFMRELRARMKQAQEGQADAQEDVNAAKKAFIEQMREVLQKRKEAKAKAAAAAAEAFETSAEEDDARIAKLRAIRAAREAAKAAGSSPDTAAAKVAAGSPDTASTCPTEAEAPASEAAPPADSRVGPPAVVGESAAPAGARPRVPEGVADAASASDQGEAEGEQAPDEEEQDGMVRGRRQDHCFVYIFRKSHAQPDFRILGSDED
mmetsp:Transcript_30983/g.68025  ORF Transcript_30983/g.68025 Transcript_30983/m.68025 type:complete len:469 (-) Transcript_30983:71-1477(-)|eukprot:CAMPEP_0204278154 /NCGR_PEP_ID=MMETSP0468-20130131/29706_1 /ASSEMBLY_ACC=CAM_ASM_000383 /TAXON_ID=2969 /ORGANISM="Oxyrrhis marina" /LENGTH=468 /DNA_ID=CAMNT_0051255027 /DNA_START=18 /DNA_END=1424 /DNA_ORIENTATION=-